MTKTNNKKLREFYVYGLYDPRNKQIFYIGKGKGDRATQHLNETIKNESSNKSKIQLINEIKNSGNSVLIKIIQKDLTEEAAFALEEILIDRIGRKSMRHGTLTNLTIGGSRKNYWKFHHTKNDMLSLSLIKKKFPSLIETIKSFPITSKEFDILDKKDRLWKNFEAEIRSKDVSILDEINFTNPKVILYPKGNEKYIFTSDHGYYTISFQDEPYRFLSKLRLTDNNHHLIYEEKTESPSEIGVAIRNYIAQMNS